MNNSSSEHTDFYRYLKLIGFFANFALIVYLFQTSVSGLGEEEVIEVFKNIRNYFYMIYIAVLLLGYLYTLIKKTKLNRLLPILMINIILTAFAYAISKLFLDLFNVL